jgi:hypothetical protein
VLIVIVLGSLEISGSSVFFYCAEGGRADGLLVGERV